MSISLQLVPSLAASGASYQLFLDDILSGILAQQVSGRRCLFHRKAAHKEETQDPLSGGRTSTETGTPVREEERSSSENADAAAKDSSEREDKPNPVVRDITHTITTEFGETKEAFQLMLDLAGVKKVDIEMKVEDNALYVSGERKKPEAEGLRFRSRHALARYGRFNLLFSLKSLKNIHPDRISAKSEDGLLIVTIPKDLTPKQTTKISIA